MPISRKKPELRSLEQLKAGALPCNAYKLADLKNVAKQNQIPVKSSLAAQCKEFETTTAAAVVETPSELVAFGWKKWISEQLQKSPANFFQQCCSEWKILSEQGHSNAILLEMKITPRLLDGVYRNAQERGYDRMVVKMFRQYYLIDNGGAVERDLYEHVLSEMIMRRTCPHLLHYFGSSSLPLQEVFGASKRKQNPVLKAAQSKLGIVKTELNSEVQLVLLERVADLVTLDDLAKREKRIDSPSAKFQTWISILFQILYTLQCFARNGLKQNDISFKNFLVEKLKRPRVLLYDLQRDDHRFVELKVDHFVRIIDFDQSSMYHPWVERNIRLDLQIFCAEHSVCNYSAHNEHYDTFGFVFQLMQVAKTKSPALSEWLSLYIDIESAQFLETTHKQSMALDQAARQDRKGVTAIDWFHQHRLHFGPQNIATNKVVAWYKERSKRLPTVDDLIFSLVDRFMPSNLIGESEVLDRTIFTLSAQRRVISTQPHSNEVSEFVPERQMLQWGASPSSTPDFSQHILAGLAVIDGKLVELNLFDRRSLLDAWVPEMQLLQYEWIPKTAELAQAYFTTRQLRTTDPSCWIALLLLACPMFSGLPQTMRNELYAIDHVKEMIDDVYATFYRRLPISMPQLNGASTP